MIGLLQVCSLFLQYSYKSMIINQTGQIITIITKTNIVCGIVTVKLNHNNADNLPIELVREIVFMYKFQHELKFQPMLQDIEDGTMCVLQTQTVFEIQCAMNPIDDNYQRLEQWASRMRPP